MPPLVGAAYNPRHRTMTLATGTRVGVYEITGAIGAGGMGEVFRAHDTRLNRDVAIKVLPELFAADPDRLARFTREAQTLAALNHPNIAHIHGLEEGSGQTFGGSVWALRLQGLPEDRKLREVGRGITNGQISPDGRWLVYQSNTSGELDVFATSFPVAGPRIQVSVNGGENARWSRDGRELFYTKDDKMMAVTVTPGATLSISAPRVLFEGRYRPGLNAVTPWDTSRHRNRAELGHPAQSLITNL